jgi:UDP-N-acetyl-2-amino-2-deoxyglucuronate dehydrogenase
VSAPVRIALVGCGRISASHFEAIARVEGLALVGVCDVLEARAKAAGEQWGVPWYTNYERMLAEVPCEAVAIATPSGLHPTQGVLAARAGKHVISEKPMAISLASADALVQACDDAGVRLFVVK